MNETETLLSCFITACTNHIGTLSSYFAPILQLLLGIDHFLHECTVLISVLASTARSIIRIILSLIDMNNDRE